MGLLPSAAHLTPHVPSKRSKQLQTESDQEPCKEVTHLQSLEKTGRKIGGFRFSSLWLALAEQICLKARRLPVGIEKVSGTASGMRIIPTS